MKTKPEIFRPLSDTIVSFQIAPFDWNLSYDRFFYGLTITVGPFTFHIALPTRL